MKVLGKAGWEHSRPSMYSFLLLNISESSEKRVLEQSSADCEKAKTDNDIVKMFMLLCDSHSFNGKQQASLVEQLTCYTFEARYFRVDKSRRLATFQVTVG